MLTVANVDLFYGASQALRGVSIGADQGRGDLPARPQRRRPRPACCAPSSACSRSAAAASSGTAPTSPSWRRISAPAMASPWCRRAAEIFPRLTVLENLQTGFSALKRGERVVPDEIYTLFPVLKSMLARRGGDLSVASSSSSPSPARWLMKPSLLILDEPTEGIQPSIIKDIAAVIRGLAARGDMAILLVEQYFDFARELADSFAVHGAREIVLAGGKDDMIESKAEGASDGIAAFPRRPAMKPLPSERVGRAVRAVSCRVGRPCR